MKLRINCGPCRQTFTLARVASTRQHLESQTGFSFNIQCPHCKTNLNANVKNVWAESSYKYAQAPTALGLGAVGFFFGPLATIIALAVGAAAGTGIKNSDRAEVNRFNNS